MPIGQGVIDWKEFFAAAKTGGVKNFFVEIDFDTYKDSAGYIHESLGWDKTHIVILILNYPLYVSSNEGLFFRSIKHK